MTDSTMPPSQPSANAPKRASETCAVRVSTEHSGEYVPGVCGHPTPCPQHGAPPLQPATEQPTRSYEDVRARLVTRDGIGWGDPFCVTPCEPDRDCELDDCPRDAVWTVEAMGCHYDGEPPDVGPTADACAAHVHTLMERWTE